MNIVITNAIDNIYYHEYMDIKMELLNHVRNLLFFNFEEALSREGIILTPDQMVFIEFCEKIKGYFYPTINSIDNDMFRASLNYDFFYIEGINLSYASGIHGYNILVEILEMNIPNAYILGISYNDNCDNQIRYLYEHEIIVPCESLTIDTQISLTTTSSKNCSNIDKLLCELNEELLSTIDPLDIHYFNSSEEYDSYYCHVNKLVINKYVAVVDNEQLMTYHNDFILTRNALKNNKKRIRTPRFIIEGRKELNYGYYLRKLQLFIVGDIDEINEYCIKLQKCYCRMHRLNNRCVNDDFWDICGFVAFQCNTIQF